MLYTIISVLRILKYTISDDSLFNPRDPNGEVKIIPSFILRMPSRVGWPLWNVLSIDDIGYVHDVVTTIKNETHRIRLFTDLICNNISHRIVNRRRITFLFKKNPWYCTLNVQVFRQKRS